MFPQCLLGPRGGAAPHLPILLTAQFCMGDVARELLASGSGCPSSTVPGAQSMVITASASLAAGLGDGDGASWLWRRAGCGGSGGGTEGARLGAPAIRRGRALGLPACLGPARAGAVLRGWATGGGAIMGRTGAGRLPGKKAEVGWGLLCWGLFPGQRGL